MAASVNLTYSINSDGTEFIFNFNASNNRNIRRVYIEYYGYNPLNEPIMECKTFNNVGQKTWSFTWKVSTGIVSWIEGYFRIKITDIYGYVTDTRKAWKENSGQPCPGFLVAWGEAWIAGDYMKLYAHASSHYNYPVRYVKFEWSGFDNNGNKATGERIVDNILDDFPSIEQDTPCSKKHPGSYKITVKNDNQTEIVSGTWAANGTIDTNPSVLSVTSFTIDKNRTENIVNNKYVVGTKFMLVANFYSRYGVKEVRFITTGSRQGDNSWASGSKAEAICTAIAPGEMFFEVIVTDNRGNIASKTLQATITEPKEDYYAYYFFDDKINKTFSGLNAQSATITLQNNYNVLPYQSDPKNLTIMCYGHQYKKLSDVEKLKHDKLSLTLLKTFTCPNVSNNNQIDIILSGADIQKLKGFNGLAFKLVDKNKVTVHGAVCSISMSYK